MQCRHGFTLIEILLVVLIVAITTTLCLDALSDTEAGFRADRAAREAVTAIRYARMLSVSTGSTYGVEFDKTAGTFDVYQPPATSGPNTVVPQAMASGGTYIVSLSQPELKGVAMSVTLAGQATNPYDLAYTNGNTTNTGTLVFTYGSVRKTVAIPAVGDPTIQ
jgi:prepilin-type N-terminal cleavage/methylation domain-containing protein